MPKKETKQPPKVYQDNIAHIHSEIGDYVSQMLECMEELKYVPTRLRRIQFDEERIKDFVASLDETLMFLEEAVNHADCLEYVLSVEYVEDSKEDQKRKRPLSPEAKAYFQKPL